MHGTEQGYVPNKDTIDPNDPPQCTSNQHTKSWLGERVRIKSGNYMAGTEGCIFRGPFTPDYGGDEKYVLFKPDGSATLYSYPLEWVESILVKETIPPDMKEMYPSDVVRLSQILDEHCHRVGQCQMPDRAIFFQALLSWGRGGAAPVWCDSHTEWQAYGNGGEGSWALVFDNGKSRIALHPDCDKCPICGKQRPE